VGGKGVGEQRKGNFNEDALEEGRFAGRKKPESVSDHWRNQRRETEGPISQNPTDHVRNLTLRDPGSNPSGFDLGSRLANAWGRGPRGGSS